MKKLFVTTILAIVVISNAAYTQLQYTNPILAGFYPDPSICRVGNDYYLTTSTFAYFPGLPIFHSTDLVNWKQIGHAMDRNGQLDQSNAGVSRGLFAPTIRYYNGMYYIMCTLIDKGGNFIITAKDPKGPWSDPIWTKEVQGIDPSLFFDEDGKTYIVYNSDPPDRKPQYNGHRSIKIVQYDIPNRKVIGEEKMLVNGGVDISQHPVWIEAPHIYKINGWYYLMCAEGGTGYNHSEVIFRSKNVDGPYSPGPVNPILTQRHLDTARKNPITTTGHADLVETPDGKWYAVFLGCRPYAGDYYNTGRETFLAPVEWTNEWPLINPGFAEVQYQYPVPFASTKKVENSFSGNYMFKDDFKENNLNERFIFLRNPGEGLYKLQEGVLQLPLKTTTAAEKGNPAFIGFRQAHLKGYAATALSFTAANENEKAGLMIFQSERAFYFLCKSVEANKPVVQLYKAAAKKDAQPELLASAALTNDKPVQLKIQADNDTYSFWYAIEKDKWVLLKDKVDGKFLSTKAAGGFVGSLYTLYATSNGSATTNTALYNWFEYKGNDDVFKHLK